jgi:hypothetical protein
LAVIVFEPEVVNRATTTGWIGFDHGARPDVAGRGEAGEDIADIGAVAVITGPDEHQWDGGVGGVAWCRAGHETA